MAGTLSNRGVVYEGPGKVEVRSIEFPKLVNPKGKHAEHGVILKIVATNICGSDQHMVRGRTTAPVGLVLGHEITGEIIEAGRDVEFFKVGDLVSVPFNVACGRCRTCKERRQPDRPLRGTDDRERDGRAAFVYRDKGSMAIIGKAKAVAQVGKWK
jgi:threonine dehydrogenase-like Zn-dependent dehydrogenase